MIIRSVEELLVAIKIKDIIFEARDDNNAWIELDSHIKNFSLYEIIACIEGGDLRARKKGAIIIYACDLNHISESLDKGYSVELEGCAITDLCLNTIIHNMDKVTIYIPE